MAEPTPIAVTQAAAMKSAAGAAGQAPPVESTQVGAVRQDLAVMADQAKGYTAGVNAGVISAQDNRAAAARRLAAEKAAEDARRAQEAQMDQMRAQELALRKQSNAQDFERRKIAAEAQAAEEPDEINTETARQVIMHSKTTKTPGFQMALEALLQDSTSPAEAVALLKNAKRNGEEGFGGINESTIRAYATAYFDALEGKAVNISKLPVRRKTSSSSSSSPAPARRDEESSDDGWRHPWKRFGF